MGYQTFSQHAPTGSTAKLVVSPNEYAVEGRTIGYPSRFSLYVTKESTVDGSFSVAEVHEPSDMIGFRLYLYHRPLLKADGGAVSIVVSSTPTATVTEVNGKQGYINLSAVPTSQFTVTYTAAPDCFSMWHLNTLQDDMMEVQRVLGPGNQTDWAGLRNFSYGVFNNPNDFTSGVVPNAIYLSHLNSGVSIASSDNAALTGLLGGAHTIQIGRGRDFVHLEGTGIRLTQGIAGYQSIIELGTKTGDRLYYSGLVSGQGPMAIGGPLWPGFSGTLGAITEAWYTGSMLRVHGNATILGGLQIVGTITTVHTTGQSSVIAGDFTIRDELFVYGVSHLIGPTETNKLSVAQNIHLEGDLIGVNTQGGGGPPGGQTLVDNLDCSEVAHTYTTAIARTLPNSVISAPRAGHTLPRHSIIGHSYSIPSGQLVGDSFLLTGYFNAQISASGGYDSILQLRFASGYFPIVSGFGTGAEGLLNGGTYSKGMFDPGSLWVEVINGAALGYKAPIYHHDIQETTGLVGAHTSVTRINAFVPSPPSQSFSPNDLFALYNPCSMPYEYIYSAGGNPPTFRVSGSTTTPLKIAFEDHVRVHTSLSSAVSMQKALGQSVSGLAGTNRTGSTYIFATSNGIDVESSPSFLARPVAFRMPGETCLGQVIASADTPFETWTILQTESFRPGGFYDSSWIPIQTGAATSGRVISNLSGAYTNAPILYFIHNLGPDLGPGNTDIDLYLAHYGTGISTQNFPNYYDYGRHSLMGQDFRHRGTTKGGIVGQSGMVSKLSLNSLSTSAAIGTNREASLVYLDGRIIGVQFNPNIVKQTMSGNAAEASYLRLVMKRQF